MHVTQEFDMGKGEHEEQCTRFTGRVALGNLLLNYSEGVRVVRGVVECLPLVLLLALITMRYVRKPEVPAPAVPLICTYAAPTSLCVAAYVQGVTPEPIGFLLILYVVASVLYVFALVQAVGF